MYNTLIFWGLIMDFTLRIIFIIFIILIQSSCAHLISGEGALPLNYKKRVVIKETINYISVPNITARLDNSNIRYLVLAFDGTNNDCNYYDDKMSDCTIVGELFKILFNHGYEGKYFSGPKFFDALFCYSCTATAESAINLLAEKINTIWGDVPNLEVRVVVMGFSRGAAIGRHFMNLVSSNFNTRLTQDSSNRVTPIVRTYAILYDTVATSIAGRLELGISTSTDFMVHVISVDESRFLFPGIKDVDLDFRSKYDKNIYSSDRILQIELPGAHSDIGVSYKEGVGAYYRNIGELTLFKFGLIEENEFIVPVDALTQGFHDSRGILDKFYDTLSRNDFNNKGRGVTKINSLPLEHSQGELLLERINKMHEGKVGRGSSFRNRETWPLFFTVIKSSNKLTVIDNINDIPNKFINYQYEDGVHSIYYSWVKNMNPSRLRIPTKVWNAIPYDIPSSLEFVLLKRDNFRSGNFYVNHVLVESTH